MRLFARPSQLRRGPARRVAAGAAQRLVPALLLGLALVAAAGCAPQRAAQPMRVVPGATAPAVRPHQTAARLLDGATPTPKTGDAPAAQTTTQTAAQPGAGAAAGVANATAAAPADPAVDKATGRRVPLSAERVAELGTQRVKELRKAALARAIAADAATGTKKGTPAKAVGPTVPLSPTQIQGLSNVGGYTDKIIDPADEFGRPPERLTTYKRSENMGALGLVGALFSTTCKNGEPGLDLNFHNQLGPRWCLHDPLGFPTDCVGTREEALAAACAKVEAAAPPAPDNAQEDANAMGQDAVQQQAAAEDAPTTRPAANAQQPAPTTADARTAQPDGGAENSDGEGGFFSSMLGLVGL